MTCIKFFFKVIQVDKDGRSQNGPSRSFAIISEAHIDRRLTSMQREHYRSFIIAIKKAFHELEEKENFKLVSSGGINIF